MSSAIAVCHHRLPGTTGFDCPNIAIQDSRYHRSGARQAGAVGSAIETKTHFDMGLNDRQFNDWNTLSFLFFAGFLGFRWLDRRYPFLERCPIVRKITSYCIWII